MRWNTLYHIGCILHCVSIGNNMIWSAIWCLVSSSKFFKDNEIARTRWASANFSLWNIYKCLFTPNYTRNHFVTYQRFTWKKRRRESRQMKFWWRTRAICNICNLHSCYIKNVLDFSHSVACTFFICIVNNVIISISLRLLVLDRKKKLLKIQESYITLYRWK